MSLQALGKCTTNKLQGYKTTCIVDLKVENMPTHHQIIRFAITVVAHRAILAGTIGWNI